MQEKRNFLQELNEEQTVAVLNTDGPTLVVAGAGSGKTKVLTSRLAYIVKEKKAWPNQILCVTFTNKAAKEMRDRVIKILGEKLNSLSWLGTFHSISVKFLRRHAEALGFKSNFTILDVDDQKKLIRNICKAENIDAKKISPQFIIALIDRWKNKGLLPDDVKLSKKHIFENQILKVYKIYQKKIKDLNACDFGDLILYCVKLFEKNHDIRSIYSNNFKYILVDEYQDTNFIQNKWLNLIVNENKNICCVGDDDQSIYSWRGAEIKNFLSFDKVYPDCKIFRLEQNYRSTKNILDTASYLISHNKDRLGKKLWSDGQKGDLVKLNCYRNGKEEAQGVGDIIEQNIKKKNSLNNIAILVRAIYQTREFEERFLKIGVNYRIIGGTKFYERAEVKDAICYLRVINQKFDDLAFERIVNTPRRGLGETTIKQLHEYSSKSNLCLEDSVRKLIELDKFKPKIKAAIKHLLDFLTKWRADLKTNKHYDLLKIILDESGYSEMLKNKKDLENENRLENLKELLRAMRDYDNLQGFLEHVALATSIDQKWEDERVNIMTMHAAKGLEFDVVFLPGWEEGLFPHQKSLEEKGDFALEEERRLAYVGITRAKKEAHISFAMQRTYHGEWMDSLPSRFVNEIPEDSVEKNEDPIREVPDDFDFNQDQSFESDEEYRSPGWARLKKKLIK
ncbi:MAG: UvrD-helicase domain-containing protein [Pelagibacteraceae bacterium]|jgi:DNA helicase-2/ATP-dependent DNA helicase PcrA|nr:UvrD-helicase domain-containing protein [Pelagibacteraceae bacterium]MBO6484224.1 UvrD-helicase domain-containing protein [Pelagibacteraceae bacterium]MBO6486839.1 UvrD-helicase domain-containing protein [Pelagibacteraceae bacterium]MBO6488408.1 UvrD-helicase domain-containing protein [Pelagibacteraceae bacterium]